MTIPKITPYSGGVANPDGSQTQTEFTQNMFDQLSYEAELSTELNNTVDGINDTATQVDADAISAAQSALAAEAAVSGLNYQGLWPDTGGSADKGDTYQTQVSGTPTGQYFTALQNTTVDPIGDDINWRAVVSNQSLGGITNYQAASVDGMISGETRDVNNITLAMRQVWSTGVTNWEVINTTGPITEENFRAFNVVSIKDFGALSDYSGTPVYDGSDSTRVTASDNTEPLRRAALSSISSGQALYIPKGHFGVIDGNIDIDLNGSTLTIVGEGDDSILDFFKEDTSHTSGVNRDDAQCIFKLHNGKLKTRDIRIKATTNLNNVNGDNDPDNQPIIFYAAIWGIIGFDVDMELESTTVDHFNFRGITTGGSVENRTQVTMVNCKGFRNVGSGFWWEFSDVTLHGGEFYRNGRAGTIHVGYGMTAQNGCGDVYVTGGAIFRENYRKGVDSHETENMIVNHCIFIDNRMYDCGFTSPFDNGYENDYSFEFNTVQYGRNADFIAEFDQAYINLGGVNGPIPKTFVQGDEVGLLTSDQRQSVTNNSFYVASGGQLSAQPLKAFIFGSTVCKFNENEVDFAGFNQDLSLDFNQSAVFISAKDGADWSMKGNDITLPKMGWGGDLYNNALIKLVNGYPSIFRMSDNEINMRDLMLFSEGNGSSAEEIDQTQLNLKAKRNDIILRDLKLANSSSSSVANATDYIVKKRYFLVANLLLDVENTFTLSDDVSFTTNATPYSQNQYGRLTQSLFRKGGSTALQGRLATIYTIDTASAGGTVITLDVEGVGSAYQVRAISSFTGNFTVKTDDLTSSAIEVYSATLDQVGSTNFYIWGMPIHAVNGLSENTFKVTLLSESFVGSDLVAFIDVAS